MNPLPDGSTASYNGYSFGLYTQTEGIEGTPVYDPAGRTVSHIVYSITLKSIIQNDGGTDASLQTIRRQLEAPAGAFSYQNKGFGNLTVNTAGGQGQGIARDVIWGPKPKMLRWRPIGGPAACEITWRCEVAVAPECPNAASSFALMEFNYSLKITNDRAGYTRRTISGHVRVPQTRQSQQSRKIIYSADDYRETIYPKVPVGFRREDRDFDLSADKCTLTFTIVDSETPPNVPPRGVVDCSASHSVSSGNQGLARWMGAISGTYEVAKDQPRGIAWQYFWALCLDRMNWAAKNAKQPAGGSKIRATVYPIGLSISEPDIYGRAAASFTLTYVILNSLPNIVSVSGLWRPVPNSDYLSWAQSMQPLAWNVRGNAKMKFDPSQDVIVDLCQPVKSGKSIAQVAAAANGATKKGKSDVAGLPVLTADNSWVVFDNRVRLEERHDRVILKPLPKNKNDRPDAIIQDRATPSYEAVMEGYAMRIGFPISPPKLTSVGGIPAFPLNKPGQGFKTWVAANFAAPAWAAQWQLRYVLQNLPPGPVKAPDNPLLGQPQRGGAAAPDKEPQKNMWQSFGGFGHIAKVFVDNIKLPPKLQ
ncbi:MAG: hypothetical protein KGL39_07970 [Patescibacteria group bacterium]|nr:hypothetical protein [Patescibacteria group bacterium]